MGGCGACCCTCRTTPHSDLLPLPLYSPQVNMMVNLKTGGEGGRLRRMNAGTKLFISYSHKDSAFAFLLEGERLLWFTFSAAVSRRCCLASLHPATLVHVLCSCSEVLWSRPVCADSFASALLVVFSRAIQPGCRKRVSRPGST